MRENVMMRKILKSDRVQLRIVSHGEIYNNSKHGILLY